VESCQFKKNSPYYYFREVMIMELFLLEQNQAERKLTQKIKTHYGHNNKRISTVNEF